MSDKLSGYELNRAIAKALEDGEETHRIKWENWAYDTDEAIKLCYRWAVEHGRSIMIVPKDDGECQAVFMRLSDNGEDWESDIFVGWHRGRTSTEALARLALSALRIEKRAKHENP